MSETSFPTSPEQVAGTLAEVFRHQSKHEIVEILTAATPTIEETGYDNIDGGVTLFTLYLALPAQLFARVESRAEKIETEIRQKCRKAIKSPASLYLSSVSIKAAIDPAAVRIPRRNAPDADVAHIWEAGMLRLFISHVSAHKAATAKIKAALAVYGISGFVAHEDIEPSREWQHEIELALRSMHALLALLTPDFKASKWTDHEVGFAIGKGILVVPVTLGLTPYGFMAKTQGLPGTLVAPEQLASDVADVLLKQASTASQAKAALIVGLEKASSFATANLAAQKIQGQSNWSPDQIKQVAAAAEQNSQVKGAWKAAGIVAQLVNSLEPPKSEEVPF